MNNRTLDQNELFSSISINLEVSPLRVVQTCKTCGKVFSHTLQTREYKRFKESIRMRTTKEHFRSLDETTRKKLESLFNHKCINCNEEN